MLAGLVRWKGDVIPDKVGTVCCNFATYLEPGREYLLWGKLPAFFSLSPGSTVMTELASSRSVPRGIMVGRILTPLWADRWVPLKVVNTSGKTILLRRNAKLADVFPCIALEDFDLTSCSQSTSLGTAASVKGTSKLESMGPGNAVLNWLTLLSVMRTYFPVITLTMGR